MGCFLCVVFLVGFIWLVDVGGFFACYSCGELAEFCEGFSGGVLDFLGEVHGLV